MFFNILLKKIQTLDFFIKIFQVQNMVLIFYSNLKLFLCSFEMKSVLFLLQILTFKISKRKKYIYVIDHLCSNLFCVNRVLFFILVKFILNFIIKSTNLKKKKNYENK